jgi:copper(I)-binding protein
MKMLLLATVIAAALAVLLYLQPPVAVSGAYVEVVPPDLAIVGFTFANWGLREVCIAEVEAPAGLSAELHVTEFNGTLAVMKTVDRVCAGPFSTVKFGSLAYHIMLVGDVAQISDEIRLQLVLSDGRRIPVAAARGTGGVHIHGR